MEFGVQLLSKKKNAAYHADRQLGYRQKHVAGNLIWVDHEAIRSKRRPVIASQPVHGIALEADARSAECRQQGRENARSHRTGGDPRCWLATKLDRRQNVTLWSRCR